MNDHPSMMSDTFSGNTGAVLNSDKTPPVQHRLKNLFSKKESEKTKGTPESDKPPPVSIGELFAYAERREVYMLIFALVNACIHGALTPCFTIVFGSILDDFGAVLSNQSQQNQLVSDIGGIAKYFFIIGAGAFVTSFFQVRFALVFAQRVTNRLRALYFRSLMRQDHSWYDSVETGELTARVAGDVNLIESGISDKLTNGVQYTSAFITGIIIAFVYGWKLTLVILAAAPFLIISGALFAKQVAAGTSKAQDAYASAGAIASEAFSLIRTVTAFSGQEAEACRYDEKLQLAYAAAVRKAGYSGVALGFTYFVIFCTFAIAFVFGAYEVRREAMAGGDVVVTFFSVFIATLSLGQTAPAFNALSVARGAAPRVYEVIRRDSEIDSLNDEDGVVLDSLQGDIRFENVQFNYPTRVIADDVDVDTDVEKRPYVLDCFNLEVKHGSSHALVGFSGCGKSTTVRLVERFYDVNSGRVLIDGVDIREYNVRWLRSQIGYVGQMPTLFMLSIRDNIALGAPMEVEIDKATGNKMLKRRFLTNDEIVNAAKMANAHDFIMKLPEKYDTMLGERGALLSGGQKQRICIARALVRNPKILLLDESTSALDAQSERHVQDALEKAAAGRTTITIAHRLSTVKNCGVISVINNGALIESGSHDELMLMNGAYRTLIENQSVAAKKTAEQTVVKVDNSSIVGAGAMADDSTTKGKSLTKALDEAEGIESGLPPTDPGVFKRAFVLNRRELPIIFLGMLGAAVVGASFPGMAIAFSSVIVDTFRPDNAALVRKWALIFVAIGAASFIGNILQFLMLGISGGRLTRKLRSLAFRATLRQEMGYFDRKENSVGQLATRLATEATLVQGITGDTLGSLSLVASTLLTGFLVAFLSCWEVALVLTGLLPLMAFSEAAQVQLITGFDADSSVKFAKAGAVASEAVDNFDTVTSIGVQDFFIERYEKELEGPMKNGRRRALVSGLTFGVSEFLSQALWAVAFWVGSVFVGKRRCDFESLMRGISGLLFAGSAIGQTALFMPDLPKSKIAATSIFRLLDRDPTIDPTDESGESRDAREMRGLVEMRDVEFEYPTRPDVRVLRGMSLDARPGQTVALVGESGCGKSTVVALLERFYDPRKGCVDVDGLDARRYKVGNLRHHFGLVSQEPDLFNRSVRDNIAYGLGHEAGTIVTEDAIETAARAANAHDFISGLPDGYNTVIGARGSRLSGGQRQRVAIARSLVRDPRVLLLDEATSALDAVSEQLVQSALNAAAKGRTTIAIAHRLSTIKDADVIGVVENGRIVEKGKHHELMQRNGKYAALVRNQVNET